jgi:amino acid transporter
MTEPVPPPTPPSTAEDKTQPARLAYAHMRSCQVMAMIFTGCGVLVFILLYDRYIAPDLWAALRDVSTMGMVLMVFLPALILSHFARKHEKRYLELIKPQ